MLNFDNLNIILFILPVYQMLFYTVQLITLRKNNDPSRRPLGFLMLLMVLYLSVTASRYLGYVSFFNYLYIFQIPLLLALLPTYYLYLQTLSSSSGGMLSKHPFMYYLPSVFVLLLNTMAFVNMSPEQTDIFLSSSGDLVNEKDNAVAFAVLVFLMGNVGFIAAQLILTPYYYIRLLKNLLQVRKSNTTYLPHLQMNWSHAILGSMLAFVLFCAVLNFLSPAYNNNLSAFLNVGILISGGLAGFLSLKQDKLYVEVASIDTSSEAGDYPVALSEEKVNFSETNVVQELISEDEAGEIISQLKHHFATNKPYLDNKLRSVDLAQQIGTSKQKLTFVINNVMDTNFYGIVNNYRVLEAKELLQRAENQHYNIDAIAQMVGFQSKSSFNGCFKKMTGQTPSEFRKQNGN